MELFKPGKVTVVYDHGAGSSGKGAINAHAASKYKVDCVVNSNMANSGHQSVLSLSEYTGNICEGNKAFKMEDAEHVRITLKCLPSSSLVTRKIPVLLMADAGIGLERFFEELKLIDDPTRIKIHPRACVITDAHKEAASKKTHVAGVMAGCSPSAAEKMLRLPDVKLAKDYPELAEFIGDVCGIVQNTLTEGGSVLYESSQGFELSLNHGFKNDWPKVTSRDVTPAMALNACGVSPKRIGVTLANVRPYPIRVGNFGTNSSGSFYESKEITWADVDRISGANNVGKSLQEITTVTNRIRRVFTFSVEQFVRAIRYCEPDYLALTFVSQIDYRSYGATSVNEINPKALVKIAEFVAMLEMLGGVRVAILGTGPRNDQQLEIIDDVVFQNLVADAKGNGRWNMVLGEIDSKLDKI